MRDVVHCTLTIRRGWKGGIQKGIHHQQWIALIVGQKGGVVLAQLLAHVGIVAEDGHRQIGNH